jgi:succinyl-diaminopimelate desuccinylase
MPLDPVALAQDLIRFRSITPEDDGALAWMRGTLESLGLACTDLPFGTIKNLFARIGQGGPHFCFCGHTDVVPPGDESAWKHPPFSATVEDGLLYGRGSADMKANIAAFIAALSQFVETHGAPKGSVSLLITGDEEAEAVNGTVKVLQWMEQNGQLADVYLVGEPSNPNALGDEIKIGRRGSLTGSLTVAGVQGHVAYPDRADNPLPRLVRLLAALESHVFDAGSAHFPATNLEITTIDVGNRADNVIPMKGTAKFNIRFNDRWTAETLEAELRKTLDQTGETYQLACSSNAASFLTRPGVFTGTVSQAVEQVTGRKPALATGGGTSDARFVSAYGPVVEFGLLNTVIHKVDEHVAIADLRQLTQIYLRVLELYFI